MTRSSRITSGSVRAAASTAASPSPASATTSMSSWRSRNVRRPWRTTAWSSASRTRITRGPPGGSWCPRRAIEVDRQRAAELGRALLHRRQPEPLAAHLGALRVEAAAVVGDGQHVPPSSTDLDAAWRPSGGSRCRAPPGRCAGSGSRTSGAKRGTSRDLQHDRLAGHAPQHLDVLAQHGREPFGLQRAGPQLEDDRAQLLHRAAGELATPAELGRRAVAVAREQRLRRLGRQRDPEQPLGDAVVQLAREPVALLDDAQLARALVQAGVLDRDRRVGGQQLDQLLVGDGEHRAVLLLGQVQRADHLAAGDDRHAEEGAHHAGARAATSRGSAGRR